MKLSVKQLKELIKECIKEAGLPFGQATPEQQALLDAMKGDDLVRDLLVSGTDYHATIKLVVQKFKPLVMAAGFKTKGELMDFFDEHNYFFRS